jgi:hypothetical protein
MRQFRQLMDQKWQKKSHGVLGVVVDHQVPSRGNNLIRVPKEREEPRLSARARVQDRPTVARGEEIRCTRCRCLGFRLELAICFESSLLRVLVGGSSCLLDLIGI